MPRSSQNLKAYRRPLHRRTTSKPCMIEARRLARAALQRGRYVLRARITISKTTGRKIKVKRWVLTPAAKRAAKAKTKWAKTKKAGQRMRRRR